MPNFFQSSPHGKTEQEIIWNDLMLAYQRAW